jgi:hypothetical protein
LTWSGGCTSGSTAPPRRQASGGVAMTSADPNHAQLKSSISFIMSLRITGRRLESIR